MRLEGERVSCKSGILTSGPFNGCRAQHSRSDISVGRTSRVCITCSPGGAKLSKAAMLIGQLNAPSICSTRSVPSNPRSPRGLDYSRADEAQRATLELR